MPKRVNRQYSLGIEHTAASRSCAVHLLQPTQGMNLRSSAPTCVRSIHDSATASQSHVGLRAAPAPSDVDFAAETFGECHDEPALHALGVARPFITAGPGASVRIALDGSWFEVGGVRGDLSRRPVLRRVLAVLVTHHALGRVPPLTMSEVLKAGWPNERCVRDSGAARVYQTVKRLRQVGLGDLLDHDGRGYWLKGDPLVGGHAASAA